MTIIKVGTDKYINVDRMTYVEPRRGGDWSFILTLEAVMSPDRPAV